MNASTVGNRKDGTEWLSSALPAQSIRPIARIYSNASAPSLRALWRTESARPANCLSSGAMPLNPAKVAANTITMIRLLRSVSAALPVLPSILPN
jgi:hypothetical protein